MLENKGVKLPNKEWKIGRYNGRGEEGLDFRANEGWGFGGNEKWGDDLFDHYFAFFGLKGPKGTHS